MRHEIEQRCTEHLQAAVGQLHFRLDTGGRDDSPAAHLAGQVSKERSLAYTRITVKNEHLTGCDQASHQPIEFRALAAAPYQALSRLTLLIQLVAAVACRRRMSRLNRQERNRRPSGG